MHSSRMRTGRSLTVFRSLQPGGGVPGSGGCTWSQGGVHGPRGGVPGPGGVYRSGTVNSNTVNSKFHLI